MSCLNANSPIDIDINTIAGNCDLKCAYSFNYPTSNCIVSNKEEYLSIAYDSFTTAPVKYNTIDYNVKEIRLYTPSLHSFHSSKTAAELIIIHTSTRGTNPLLVCIPCIENSSNTDASNLLSQIIIGTANNAPGNNESSLINIDNFTLNTVVPKKPFFSYTAIQPYQPCVGDVDFIVFTPQVSECNLSTILIEKLNKIITANTYTIKTGPSLFLNTKGPSTSLAGVGNDIFIDCQPVNKSIETTQISSNASSSSTVTMESITSSPFFQIIVGVLIIIVVIFLFNVFIRGVGKISIKEITPIPISLPKIK